MCCILWKINIVLNKCSAMNNATREKIMINAFYCACFAMMVLVAILVAYLSTFFVATKLFQDVLCRLWVYSLLLLLSSLGAMLIMYKPN